MKGLTHVRCILVIGAGQAGFATGYYLKQTGLSFLIMDAADEIFSFPLTGCTLFMILFVEDRSEITINNFLEYYVLDYMKGKTCRRLRFASQTAEDLV